jgi:mitochondrial fission protein ELM1
MNTLRHIRVLSDGRPGHENQSVGLAQALARRTGAAYEIVRIDPSAGLLARTRMASRPGLVDLVIAAGHRTHLPLWWAARRVRARSVVIMKPSLPLALFDLCLLPRHDLANPTDHGRVVTTRGALNRVSEQSHEKTETGLILIGGPSNHHGWDGTPLPAAINEIVRARPDLAWTIGDSRRTPEGFLAQLSGCGAQLAPHRQTQPDWLPAQLGAAREVWVTEDSVSMIFEALTAGARVGLLPMPVKNPGARTIKAVQELVADGYVRTLTEWRANPVGWCVHPSLHETARCADVIIERFFK